MQVSAANFGVASWITPQNLQMLAAHGLTLGKIAKNIAAFEILDAYIEAVDERLHHSSVAVTPGKPPMQMYTAGRKGKSSLELLIQDSFSTMNTLAMA